MGDVAISAVINKIVDIGATWVVEEFSRLYGLPREIKWLERQMRLMQAYLKVAEEKKVVDPMVQPFIEDIRDLANDVEDIFDIFLSEIYEHKSSSLLKRITCIMPYSVTCSKLSREIEKIRNRVRDIEEDKQIHNIPDINLPAEAECLNMDPRTTTLDADDSLIVGFDDHIKTVKAKLEKYQYVTIVGMAGLGKTTLAKKVFNGVKGDFQCNASVSVSRDPIINSLWQDIAKQVGLEEEKRGENLEVNLKSLLQEKSKLNLLRVKLLLLFYVIQGNWLTSYHRSAERLCQSTSAEHGGRAGCSVDHGLHNVRHCGVRRSSATDTNYNLVQDPGGILSMRPRFSGIDRTTIESLPFFRFPSLKGLKEGLECSVRLSKFEETEILRLLSKWLHAFHTNCMHR